VMIRWRERWRMHRIVLPLLRESDSANFPSDFNLPVVIFLLDYLKGRNTGFRWRSGLSLLM
jgi:hypothetical protein